MKRIIEWLIDIEDLARRNYAGLAAAFITDDDFHEFVNRLAKDETMHFQFMNDALVCLQNSPDLAAEIRLDKYTMANVATPLRRIEDAINNGKMNQQLIMEAIYESELSEWNDIFLYVINALKDNCLQFKVMGPSIQNHLRTIADFLENRPEAKAFLAKFENLSPVWEEKVLVVDDYPPILELVCSLLSKDGAVDTASNGKEALEKAARQYYAVIISDIDMPIMSGLEFYKKLKQDHGDVGRRFIFISGSLNQETRAYLKSENLNYMAKPFHLRDLRQAVHGIIDQNTL